MQQASVCGPQDDSNSSSRAPSFPALSRPPTNHWPRPQATTKRAKRCTQTLRRIHPLPSACLHSTQMHTDLCYKHQSTCSIQVVLLIIYALTSTADRHRDNPIFYSFRKFRELIGLTLLLLRYIM